MDFFVKLSTIIGGFATGVAVIFVIATLYVYRGQLRQMKRQIFQMKRTHELESILLILKYINDVEFRRARHFIYEYSKDLNNYLNVLPSWENQCLIDEKIKQWSDGQVELHHIELWINTLNSAAFFIKKGFVPADSTRSFLDPAFIHCKKHLGLYIEYRKKRHLGSDKPFPEYAMHLMSITDEIEKSQNTKALASG